ncbi:hypothetical protein CAC42_3418 [Sphaceloma murrayae]|uniref:Alpha/beta hydrolase fold-3 domain-containing protein n=1 Tax=Sphaceloma murrayae TaxID=2082308 RepID=A0A2K1R1B7_9PEZI|nr:hypothetical protein CAC42_3418 [Sphaceloma murrayae]
MAAVDQFPTPESVSALGKEKHPSYQAATAQVEKDAAEGRVPDFTDPKFLAGMRQMRKAGTDASYGPTPAGVKESTQKIKMRDGYESELRVFQPEKADAGGSPLVVLIYGGGFVMGENRQLGPYGRGLVQLYNAVVVAISYRLAPENKFPTGANDAWDSFKWITANIPSLGADPSKGFVVGGVSAGGNLSIVLTQNAIEQKIQPPLTGVWLCVPLTFHDERHVPDEYKKFYLSRKENAASAVLSEKTIQAFNGHCQQDPDSQWYSAMNNKEPFKGWPPTYIEVNGCDPLRDDGIIIDKMLRKNGTKTKFTAWPGLPHAHFALLPDMQLKKQAARDTMKGFAWLLGKEDPTDEFVDTHVDVPASG